MQILKKHLLPTGLVVLLLSLGCSEDITKAIDDFIPFINNTWANEADTTHTIFLQPDGNDRVPSGTFTGREQLPVYDNAGIFVRFDTKNLTGKWTNSTIEFTINRATPITFKGKFESATRINLNNGALILRKSNN